MPTSPNHQQKDQQMTFEDLFRILNKAAGMDGTDSDGAVVLDAQFADLEFADLGIDSLALLEAVGAIEREFSLTLPDSVAAAATPREMLDLVREAA